MRTLNRAASEAMVEHGVRAATDVTGYGLIGHLLDMLGPGIAAELEMEKVPLLEGARELAAEDLLPGGTRRNIEAGRDRVKGFDDADPAHALLFDAQTSGGLLMAVPAARAPNLLADLHDRGSWAAQIGRVTEGDATVKVIG
jgi:selenide,water dikinase